MPPIQQQSSVHIHSNIRLKSILNNTTDDKQPPFSSPQRTLVCVAPIPRSNVDPCIQHGGGSSRPHLSPISPVNCSSSNVNNRSVDSASNGSTSTEKAMVSQSPIQDPEQSAWLPSLMNSASQSPFTGIDPLSRTPSRMSGSRYGDDPNSGVAYPAPTDLLSQAGNQARYDGGPMIPVTIDLKSGSRSQAEKRKANSDASRRFRNRKKNEAALEQRISQLNEQLKFLTEERDFYRNERDHFRDTLGEHIGVAQMPPRPASPARRRTQSTASPGDQPLSVDSHQQAMGMGEEMMSKTMNTGTSSSLDVPASQSLSGSI
ncbi:hypothetical protein EIK77_005445 [Talaromyces pinophilus]|nr:hypothetical protein EIK77_005445 [Talaromyces pinophilus]